MAALLPLHHALSDVLKIAPQLAPQAVSRFLGMAVARARRMSSRVVMTMVGALAVLACGPGRVSGSLISAPLDDQRRDVSDPNNQEDPNQPDEDPSDPNSGDDTIVGAVAAGFPNAAIDVPSEPLGPSRRVLHISVQHRQGGEWFHICGGALVASDEVLTAASCVNYGRTYEQIRVVIEGAPFMLRSYVIDPTFSGLKPGASNLALLLLSEPIPSELDPYRLMLATLDERRELVRRGSFEALTAGFAAPASDDARAVWLSASLRVEVGDLNNTLEAMLPASTSTSELIESVHFEVGAPLVRFNGPQGVLFGIGTTKKLDGTVQRNRPPAYFEPWSGINRHWLARPKGKIRSVLSDKFVPQSGLTSTSQQAEVSMDASYWINYDVDHDARWVQVHVRSRLPFYIVLRPDPSLYPPPGGSSLPGCNPFALENSETEAGRSFNPVLASDFAYEATCLFSPHLLYSDPVLAGQRYAVIWPGALPTAPTTPARAEVDIVQWR